MSSDSRYLRIAGPLVRGTDVLFIQQRLQQLGFYNEPLDGQKLIEAQAIVTGNMRP